MEIMSGDNAINGINKFDDEYDRSNGGLFKIRIRWDKYLGT